MRYEQRHCEPQTRDYEGRRHQYCIPVPCDHQGHLWFKRIETLQATSTQQTDPESVVALEKAKREFEDCHDPITCIICSQEGYLSISKSITSLMRFKCCPATDRSPLNRRVEIRYTRNEYHGGTVEGRNNMSKIT